MEIEITENFIILLTGGLLMIACVAVCSLLLLIAVYEEPAPHDRDTQLAMEVPAEICSSVPAVVYDDTGLILDSLDSQAPLPEVVELVEGNGCYQMQRTVGSTPLKVNPEDTDIKFKLEIKDLGTSVKRLSMTCYMNEVEISHLASYFVKRRHAPAVFYRTIREAAVKCRPSMEQCVLELFDQHGHLQKDLYSHPVKRGAGNWGIELNKGDFFYISALYVDEKWRRLGLGKKIIEKVLKEAQEKFGVQFVFTRPGSYAPFSDTSHKDIYYGNPPQMQCNFKYLLERERRIVTSRLAATRFWRARGFRRIGNSKYFCFAMDPAHRSRIPSAAPVLDFDLPKRPANPAMVCDIEGQHTRMSCDAKRSRKMAAIWPIHKGILSTSREKEASDTDADVNCLEFLEICLRSYPISQNMSRWWSRDERGNTIAHVAADLGMPDTLQWILDHLGLEIARERNYFENTAEELITDRVELARRTFAMTGSVKSSMRMTVGESKCLSLLQGESVDFDGISAVRCSCRVP